MATKPAIFIVDSKDPSVVNVNPDWINYAADLDPLVICHKAYFLPGKSIDAKVNCCSQVCILPKRTAAHEDKFLQKTVYEPMLFCFFCNEVVHLKCLGLTLDTFKTENLPIRCFACKIHLKNLKAKAYFEKSKYEYKMMERRKQFLRADRVETDENKFDSDTEYDQEDIDAFKNSVGEQSSFTSATYNTASQSLDASALGEQIKKLLDQQQLRQPHSQRSSRLPPSSSNAQRNSTSVGQEEANQSFNFSQYFHSNAQQPQSEQSRWSFNPQPPPTINLETSASQLRDCDISTLLTRLVASQEETFNQQLLANRRKVMPKIAEFDGDALKWLEFSQDVERYKIACQYDDETVKWHVRGALKGDAFESVKNVIDLLTLQQLMDTLRADFGDPMVVVRRNARMLREFKFSSSNLYREDAIKLKQAIQSYFAACTYAKVGYLNSNELGEAIYNQFNFEDRARCKELFVRVNKGASVVICLKTIHDYILERLPLLDEKSAVKNESKREDKRNKTHQVQYTASNSFVQKNDKFERSNDSKFQIINKESAPYLGYDLQKVKLLKKVCALCDKTNHFLLQCHQFSSMSPSQRLTVVSDKNYCRNCLLTSNHSAKDCDLKLSCGFVLNKNVRCSAKHHIAIHNALVNINNNASYRNFHNNNKPRKGNTNKNTENARKAIEKAKGSNTVSSVSVENEESKQINELQPSTSAQANFHALNPRHYEVKSLSNLTGVTQINLLASNEFQKTVKMFKHNFIGPKGTVTAFSVGDSAAEVTLMREDLRVALGIKGVKEPLNLSWTDSSSKICMATKFDLVVQGVLQYSERLILRDCYAIDELNLPPRTLDMNVMRTKFPYLKEVNFEGYYNEQPVMLIGSPHAFAIESIKQLIEGGTGNPVAIEAKLGVSVYGGNPEECSHDSVYMQAISAADKTEPHDCETHFTVSNEDLYCLLKRFNSIESLGIRPVDYYLIEDEKKAIDIIKEEMRVLEDGTVEVPLVWNRDTNKKLPKLDNNFSLAYKRQITLEKKLAKEPRHREAYNNNVKELLELGYMRYANDVDLNTQWPNVWYLPMGLVINANKDPPKFRNVYDARSRYNGQSLNDLLLKGPDLLVNLIKPLLRLRMNKIAFCADIQHMFHRVKICLRDQQCQRVLWRENSENPMSTLILSAMAFGPKCSPFVSQYVKNWNADNWANAYPEAAKAAKELIYMDDALISESSVKRAIRMSKQLIEMFRHINWNLVSFQSNSIEFLKALPHQYIKKELIPLMTEEVDEHITKVLGCSWSTTEDAFVFRLDKNIFVRLMTEFDHKPTKKDFASLIARIFDAMGFISHFVIRGKILLQRTWKLKIAWDEQVPDELHSEWKIWLSEIENVAKLKIPRMLCNLDSLSQADKLELHVFCDAGAEAFGACAYLVVHTKSKITSRLVMAKAKVTPIRYHTETEVKEIPRLELNSALIAARLSKLIIDAYNDLNLIKFYWSDSEIVLRWILNPNHRLLKYAIGPIEEILEISQRNDWRYVPSVLNPADTCTKFKKFDFANPNSCWFLGPEFIRKDRDEWPQLPSKLIMEESILTYNIYSQTLIYSTHVLPPIEYDYIIDKLSPSITATWRKLRRAVARALKLFLDGFIPLIKSKQFHDKILRREIKKLNNNFQILTTNDYERAEHFIFRKIQRESFVLEYNALKTNKAIKNPEFQRLNAFMDPQGLIRINSRVNLNDLNFPQQFCPLLPRKGDLMYTFLRYYHLKYNHIALESQIAEIRSHCWVPKLRQALKNVKSRCNACKLRDKRMYEPVMAPLPEFRTNPSQQPFEVVALDCFGPYLVKCSNKYRKIWILIFVCTLTRFVHLHILESLESLRVLEAIVVFWAAHGPIRKFVSDNGLNFVGAAKILRDDYDDAKIFLRKKHPLLASKISEKYQIDWEFIPPYSPWMGGVYERLIKEAKRALYDILNMRKIDKIELNIAINEVSHRLNLRPLTYNSISADDDIVLTPHHLAKHRSGWPLLPGIHKGQYAQINDKDVYRKGRALADQIMAKFTAYYLPEYTRRSKWYKDKKDVRVDDLVLIIEPRDTRKEWTRGRIVKIRKNKDGKGRRADVLLADGRIKLCAVRNLARLDIST